MLDLSFDVERKNSIIEITNIKYNPGESEEDTGYMWVSKKTAKAVYDIENEEFVRDVLLTAKCYEEDCDPPDDKENFSTILDFLFEQPDKSPGPSLSS